MSSSYHSGRRSAVPDFGFRADMSCHWEETDSAIQEMWSNVSGVFFYCKALYGSMRREYDLCGRIRFRGIMRI